LETWETWTELLCRLFLALFIEFTREWAFPGFLLVLPVPSPAVTVLAIRDFQGLFSDKGHKTERSLALRKVVVSGPKWSFCGIITKS
jgi:hypothetical protein